MKKVVFACLLAGSASAFAQSTLSVDWVWKKDHRCSSTSPALKVSGLPEGTKSLAINMIDRDFQNKSHGGGSVPVSGGDSAEVAEGALKDYNGPCPSNYSSFGHDYEITVKALGADGQELAKGVASKNFSAGTAQ